MAKHITPRRYTELQVNSMGQVFARAMSEGDMQVVKGLQMIGSSNWNPFTMAKNISKSLIIMALNGRRDIRLQMGPNDLRITREEKKLKRYLLNHRTSIDYLKYFWKIGIIDIDLHPYTEQLIENAIKNDKLTVTSHSRAIMRDLSNENRGTLENFSSRDSDEVEEREVEELRKRIIRDTIGHWYIIRLNEETWGTYLENVEVGGEEEEETIGEINFDALGSVLGMAHKKKAIHSTYRPLRAIIQEYSGKVVPIDELRDTFISHGGRDDRFDYIIGEDINRKSDVSLITFEGEGKVKVDRTRAAKRALDRVLERANERYRGISRGI